VGRFLVGAAAKGVPDPSFRIMEINGGPAIVALSAGKPDSVFQLDVFEGRVQAVYIMRNPDKLQSLPLD
jgi:RNA polymerase sigma-70 factor (ECF subfamily)